MNRCFLIFALVGSLQMAAYSLRADDLPSRSISLHGPEGELRRRALFGAQLAAITKEIQVRQKLKSVQGVLLEKIHPGTSAAESEFRVGDVVLAVGGEKIADVTSFLVTMAKRRAGDIVTFETIRDGLTISRQVTLKEMPREKGEGYEVIYGSVMSHGARLRTIITRPKSNHRHSAVLLLQGGHTCFPIETPIGEPTAFTWMVRDLTRHGFATLRIERPGCGDSEGGPLRDVDFDTELDGYKQALRAAQAT